MKPVWLIFAVLLAAFVVRRRARLEPTVIVGALIAAALGAVYSTGQVHLPNLDKVLEDVGQALGAWTYLLVAVLAFAETGAFIGLVAPGETAIIVGGVVAGQGEINLIALIALVWASAVAGDMTSFLLGHRLGRGFMVRHGRRIGLDEPKLEKVEAFFARHGGKAIFVGRFVGLVRAVAPFLAGASRMPMRRFAPYDILGAGLWGTTFCVLGYLFWHSIDTVISIAKTGALALGSTIAVVAAAIAAIRWLGEEENRERASAWLEEQSQRPLIRPVAALSRPLIRWSRRPARFAWARLTPGDLGLEVTTLLAVAAVGLLALIGYGTYFSGDVMRLTPGDRRGIEWADALRTDWLDDACRALTHLGSLPVAGGAVVVVALALLSRREVVEATSLVAGLAITFAAVHLIKNGIDRPRPAGALVGTEGSAFPSGHSAYAVGWTAITLALRHALTVRATAIVLIGGILLTVAIGLTRVELRAHWFSDVAGGWGLGAASFALSGTVALFVGYLRQNPRSS